MTAEPTATEDTTRPGMDERCNKLHRVIDDDGGCWDISQAYGITLDQFYAWNPSGKLHHSWRLCTYVLTINSSGR